MEATQGMTVLDLSERLFPGNLRIEAVHLSGPWLTIALRYPEDASEPPPVGTLKAVIEDPATRLRAEAALDRIRKLHPGVLYAVSKPVLPLPFKRRDLTRDARISIRYGAKRLCRQQLLPLIVNDDPA